MVTYRGGSGESVADAVLLDGARNSILAEQAEFSWLSQKLGVPNRHWRIRGHASIDEGGRHYEKTVVALPDGTRKEFYFDVTETAQS